MAKYYRLVCIFNPFYSNFYFYLADQFEKQVIPIPLVLVCTVDVMSLMMTYKRISWLGKFWC